MTFSTNDFLAQYPTGWMRPALFQAWFVDDPLIRYNISNANLPGRSIITDVFQHVPAVPLQKPVGMSRNSASFTCIVDQEQAVLKDLENRMALIVDDQGGTNQVVGYEDEYISDFHIRMYKENGETARDVILKGCYIVGISDVSLGWANSDAIGTVDVNLYYRTAE